MSVRVGRVPNLITTAEKKVAHSGFCLVSSVERELGGHPVPLGLSEAKIRLCDSKTNMGKNTRFMPTFPEKSMHQP